MTTLQVVNHLVNHLVKEGKDRLLDTYIKQQKVPPYANTQSNSDYQEIILHAGFKAEQTKKFGYFRIKRDQQPVRSTLDSFAVNATKIIVNPNTERSIVKQNSQASAKKFGKYHKSNQKSNLSIKSVGFNTMKLNEKTQTNFFHLQESPNLSEVGTRVKQKHEEHQEYLRNRKEVMIFHKNKEIEENQAFQSSRENRQNEKKKIVTEHMSKGSNYKFNYDDDGEIVLFQSTQKTINTKYPKETPYKIQKSENEQNEQNNKPLKRDQQYQRYKSNHFSANKYTNNNDNQRIKSARGLAFASSVLKTMNLSKIYTHNSYQEFQPEQFMKRNDLFNNNHSRQTTNMPYFQPKSGTVYTEIATNQIIGTKPSSSAKTHHHAQSQLQNHENTFAKVSKKFQSFLKKGEKLGCKTSQQQYSKMDKMDEERPIKTADHTGRRQTPTQKRPHSSTNNRGRIITANENLILNLLQ